MWGVSGLEECESDRTYAGLLPLLVEVKKRLENVYGERLVDVIPYGVECLDEASNADVAVVLKKKGNVNRETRRVSRVLKDIIERTPLNIHILSYDNLEKSNWPLYFQRKNREKIRYLQYA
nr:hypothetical protein [Candidatus Bathyarchaeota archaeon]